MGNPTNRSRFGPLLAVATTCLLLAAGCKETTETTIIVVGDDDPEPTPTELEFDEEAPGLELTILAVEGATGGTGSFEVGDSLSVTFELRKTDGSPWDIAELTIGQALVSGPSFNYQRVLAETSALPAEALGDGVYRFSFPTPLPATYLAPYHDSPSFGVGEGELTGQALLAGTYTLGLYFGWDYTAGERDFRAAADGTLDFLFGGAGVLMPREVVGQANCDQCHVTLEAHEGLNRSTALCVLCHTAGAEDLNDPLIAGGTPGVATDFRVMIHKLHNGSHQPSVLGIGVNPDGTRDYSKTPVDYELVGADGEVKDFSHVAMPAWPGLSQPMLKDFGYAAALPTVQAQEDAQRTGITRCATCHGDPDDDGPLVAPAQGDLIEAMPTKHACGACHDDVDWALPYDANFLIMPADVTNAECLDCHFAGVPIGVVEGHLHPLEDPSVARGLNFQLASLGEAGVADFDGTLDPGEKIAIQFTMRDDTGADLAPSELEVVRVVVSGPTDNMNLVLNTEIPTAALIGAQPFGVNLPEAVQLELLGHSTVGIDVFQADLTPIWDVAGAPTRIWTRLPAAGGSSSLALAVSAPANWLDVVDPSGFARNDIVVVDDGVVGKEEYLRIQHVDGNRLWFASPYQLPSEALYRNGTSADHAVGASVIEVALANRFVDLDYTIDHTLGQITEVNDFGDGVAVLASYTGDFVLPETYPLALNSSPDIDESWGKWSGKSLVSGTYRLGIWGALELPVDYVFETTDYLAPSEATLADFLVRDASMLEPFGAHFDLQSCTSCHKRFESHGGLYRGVEGCFLCHGTAGAEDRPQYRAPNAPATPGNLVDFASMVHKLHSGSALTQAASYGISASGDDADFPDNYSFKTFEQFVFPAMPGAAMQCSKCHGDTSDAWIDPPQIEHPSEQDLPVRAWRTACSACHDAPEAVAHIDAQTSPAGAESCALCHEPGSALGVEEAHRVR